MNPCEFCEINAYARRATDFRVWAEGLVTSFEPLHPVTPGHLLITPVRHVEHAAVDPDLTGRVMKVAARLAQDYPSCNLITSVGREATQTVFHLHVHLVPRRQGDGLILPWSFGAEV